MAHNLCTKPFKTLICYFFIETHKGFRSAPTHFASNETKMIIASVPYNGELPENLEFNWEIEHIIELGADMREAYFLRRDFMSHFYLWNIIAKNTVSEKSDCSLGPKGEFKGKLMFYFFKAGTDPLEFAPDNIHYIEKIDGKWSDPVKVDGVQYSNEICCDIATICNNRHFSNQFC